MIPKGAQRRALFVSMIVKAESYANLRSGSPLNHASMPSTIWA
jgi:hypothetical protein